MDPWLFFIFVYYVPEGVCITCLMVLIARKVRTEMKRLSTSKAMAMTSTTLLHGFHGSDSGDRIDSALERQLLIVNGEDEG
jgi:hypothetical protein